MLQFFDIFNPVAIESMRESNFSFGSQRMALPLAFFIRFGLFTLFTFVLPCVISQGLTFDDCVSTRGCVPPRTCELGRCTPPRLIRCLSDDACPEGEGCYVIALTSGPSPPICVSTEVAIRRGAIPVTPPNPSGESLTGEQCFRNNDCRSPRACILIREGSFDVCVGKPGCICAPPVFQECETDDDCPEGESCGFIGLPVCAAIEGGPITPVPKPTAIVDPDFVEDSIQNGNGPNSSSDTAILNRGVCVAERHLEGVRGIYESGRLAHVLCDSRGSCATPGHFVVFHGKGMMMRSYCDVAGCTESIMKVNSPKWERQLRVKSWSNGLEFTAFAARYETLAEEMVLAGAVRAGV